MSSNSISQHERHGVWVPASAGTTLMAYSSSPRPPLTTRHSPFVVPANAGTHNHQGVVLRRRHRTASLNTSGTAYGSLRPCLVPGDWVDGIGVEQGIAYLGERLASWN